MALQNFLLSAKARTISLKTIFDMSEDAAYEQFRRLRWPDDGEPVCPRCGCVGGYPITKRRRFKCAEQTCLHQFSVTSGTIFAGRKKPFRDLLAAIVVFVNGASGVAALRLGRELDMSYKTAFVLAHKLREAMGREQEGRILSGIVEIDGAGFGGYIKPENQKKDRIDRRMGFNRTGKRRTVAIARERNGLSRAWATQSEGTAVPLIRAALAPDAIVYADEGASWDSFHATHEVHQVNHSVRFFDEGVCTNQAECYFSRLRRAETGVYHSVEGPHLQAYASEMVWREDHRRTGNGEQVTKLLDSALGAPVSRAWKGYWQRHEVKA